MLPHLAQAANDSSGRWFIGYASGYQMGDDRPDLFAQSMCAGLWETILGGRGYYYVPDGTNGLSDWISGNVSRTGKLGTVMMDFVGDYNTNAIRNDLIRRNLGK